MVRHITFDHWEPLRPEQIQEIDEAVKRPIIYDEDSPDLTPETFAAFQRAAAKRDALKKLKAM